MRLKLSKLIEMYKAMATIVDLPTGQAPNTQEWIALMHAKCYLEAELLMMDDEVEVINERLGMV